MPQSMISMMCTFVGLCSLRMRSIYGVHVHYYGKHKTKSHGV